MQQTGKKIRKCSKLAQKEYKARHDWVGKLIHWEMCKKFKFDHVNKWYMHNPASVLENDTHKLLCDFNIQTDHLISARTPNLIIINKKKKKICQIVNFAVPTFLSRITSQYHYTKFVINNEVHWFKKRIQYSFVIDLLTHWFIYWTNHGNRWFGIYIYYKFMKQEQYIRWG